MILFRPAKAALLCLAAVAGLRGAEDNLASLTKAVTEFRLANGIQFFVVERPYAPIVSFHLRVKAGAADEPSGQHGVAVMALLSFLEGSEIYGSRNRPLEKAALAEALKLQEGVRVEDAKGEKTDEILKGRADYHSRSAFDQAAAYGVSPRFYESVMVQNGVTGLEMRPSADFSDLAFTLPSHRAELWFRMVGSWLQAPSSRFFPQSRALAVDQRAQVGKTGTFQREQMFGQVFSVHPYRAIGAPETELGAVAAIEVRQFQAAHYVPANMTVAIVGDIAAVEARRLAEFYFGRLPATPSAERTGATPFKAEGVQQFRLAVPEAPVIATAWPRPSGADADDAAFDMLQALLGGGTGGRLHGELMGAAQLARRMVIVPRYPGGRYPGLFLIEAEPQPQRSHDEVEAAILKTIDAMKTAGVTAEEMGRASAWWRNRFASEARTASGRASQLARFHTEMGSYKLEDRLARLHAVTVQDCQRVLGEYMAGKPYFSVLQLTAVMGEGQ
jgi:predicted Zn-dependent peptidase